MMMVGVAFNLPLYTSCSKKPSLLSKKQEEIFRRILDLLFPKDGIGPDVEEIHVFDYFLWTLEDPNLDPDESQYVIRGITWLNETSQEELEQDFTTLSRKEQEDLVKFVSETRWGESWLSTLLTIIFEALLLDPIYALNEQEKSWKWLDHKPGNPRPNKQNSYPAILERKLENSIFSNLDQL